MKRSLLIFLALFLQQAYAQSWLWKVSGNGLTQPSYLFGTMHVICEEDLKWPSEIDIAIQHCKVMIQENVEMDTMDKISLLQLSYMKDGKRLNDFLDSSEMSVVKAFFRDSLRMPFVFSRFRPMLTYAAISMYLMECKGVSMMEEQLLRKARSFSLQLDQLESVNEQLAFLDSIPYKDQAHHLVEAIQAPAKSRLEMKELMQLYRQKNPDSIAVATTDHSSGMHEIETVLLNNRNFRWLGILEKKMRIQPVFVAVGAAHLGGEKGLIKLLRAKGYTVSPEN